MHFLFGLALLGASLVFTFVFHESRFESFLHPPALVLVGVAPIAIVIMGHGPQALGRAIGDFVAALSFRRQKRAFNGELAAFSELLQRGRLAEAAGFLERCVSPLRQYGLLSLERYSREQYVQVLAALRSDRLHALKDSEEVFQTLAQVTPSVGMVGTVLGLVGMLVHLQSFQELASGMALALLTTFYGLLLGRCLYSPLVAALRTYAFSLQSTFAKLESTYALHVTGRSALPILGTGGTWDGNGQGAHPTLPAEDVSRVRP
jgi:chemotaxis protein MotA